MNRRWILLAGMLSLVLNANAEVQVSHTDGFIVSQQRTLQANTDAVFTRMTAGLSIWWDANHSFSGSSANLKPDRDCLCEAWDENLVRHLNTVSWIAGDKVILQGGMGPLKELGLSGTMIWSVTATSARDTVVHWKYHVSGIADADLLALAPVVDGVLSGQMDRLAAQFSRQ